MIQRSLPDPPQTSTARRPAPPPVRVLETEDYLLLAAASLLPWAFGGVEIWAYRSAALLLVAAGAVAIYKDRLRLGRDDARLWLPAGLLLAWAAFQLVPLPPAALRVLSPGAHRVYGTSLPGYPGAMAEDTLGALELRALALVPEADGIPPPGGEPPDPSRVSVPACAWRWRPISLDPSATMERLFWYLALLVGFLVVRQRGADPDVHALYRGVLFVVFVALAAFGLLQALEWTGKLYWIRPLQASAIPFGPYVNPNHFAGVMEIAVPWLAGYTWSRAREDLPGSHWGRALVLVQLIVICVGAGLAARSLTGAVLIGASLALLGVAAMGSLRGRLAMAGCMVAALCLASWFVSGTPLGDEFAAHHESSKGAGPIGTRAVIWGASLGMWLDFPLTGTGFGSFREIFPRYLPAGAKAHVLQAHNDYLEVLLDGGIIAGLLLLALSWGFWSRIPLALRRATDSGSSLAHLGLVLGVVSLSLHALVDFNHQIPANALLFVTACGLAAPRDLSGAEGERGAPRRLRQAGLLLVGLGLLVYVSRAVSGTVGGVALARASLLDSSASYERTLSLYERAAVGSDRTRALRNAAETRLESWDSQARKQGADGADPQLLARAAEGYVSYLCASPASWRPFEGLGDVYFRKERARRRTEPEASEEEQRSWARVGRPGRIAVGMIRSAAERAPNWYPIHDQLALTCRRLGLRAEARRAVRASASAQPRFYLHRYPQHPPDLPDWILDSFADGSWEALGRVPFLLTSDHLLALGQVELKRKNLGRAAGALTMALELPANAYTVAQTRYHLGWALLEAKRYEEARMQLELAGEHPSFRVDARNALSRLAAESGGGDPGH